MTVGELIVLLKEVDNQYLEVVVDRHSDYCTVKSVRKIHGERVNGGEWVRRQHTSEPLKTPEEWILIAD